MGGSKPQQLFGIRDWWRLNLAGRQGKMEPTIGLERESVADIGDKLFKVFALDVIARAVKIEEGLDVVVRRYALRLFPIQMPSYLPCVYVGCLQGQQVLVVSEDRLSSEHPLYLWPHIRLDELIPFVGLTPDAALLVKCPINSSVNARLIHEFGNGNDDVAEAQEVGIV